MYCGLTFGRSECFSTGTVSYKITASPAPTRIFVKHTRTLLASVCRDAESGYTLSVGRGPSAVATAAAAASGGLTPLPPGLELAAAAGAGGVGAGGVILCVVRDGEAARMGNCDEQATLTLQVRRTIGY